MIDRFKTIAFECASFAYLVWLITLAVARIPVFFIPLCLLAQDAIHPIKAQQIEENRKAIQVIQDSLSWDLGTAVQVTLLVSMAATAMIAITSVIVYSRLNVTLTSRLDKFRDEMLKAILASK